MKCCKLCRETKPLDAFTLRSSGRYRTACKVCRAGEQQERRALNPERAAEIERQRHEKHKMKRNAATNAYYHVNSERYKAKRKEWYRANREHSLRLVKDWYAANKGRSLAYKTVYRQMKRRAVPPWADAAEIAKFYKLAQFMRDITGDDYHVDHIVPLRGELVCGLHTHNNLRVIPAEENMAKHNTLIEDLACAPLT